MGKDLGCGPWTLQSAMKLERVQRASNVAQVYAGSEVLTNAGTSWDARAGQILPPSPWLRRSWCLDGMQCFFHARASSASRNY